MRAFVEVLWLVPALPALSAVVLGCAGWRFPRRVTAVVACASVLFAFVVAAGSAAFVLSDAVLHAEGGEGLRVDAASRTAELTLWEWMPVGEGHGADTTGASRVGFLSRLAVPLAFTLDPLSAVMILVVTGVGFLIHVYATGYMWEEKGYWRFFAYLNLFVAMMLVLVLGSSFALMFVGWEGVGLCSYLLIGFTHDQEFPPTAGMKAFLVNRIGDLGFILGLLLLLLTFGSVTYAEVFPRAVASSTYAGSAVAVAIAALLFVGCTGKSAQVPLHVWLPDAMAGPTPVSALIHAATMVTAGVYLVIRANVLFQAAPAVSAGVAVVGALTAIVAASIALVQNDIKRVLAYSTVSQLGYMFLAVGAGAYAAGLFHLVTHAFFKALLFLGAGSVSHALHGELDVRKMGGLRKELPGTHLVMLVATVAIAGIPPLSGFWSKDEILAGVVTSALPAGLRSALWWVALLGAFMTAFYMFRLYHLTFGGRPRWSAGVHPHESPAVMLLPLYVLALLAVVGGTLNLPAWMPGAGWLHHHLAAIVHGAGAMVTGAGHPLEGTGEAVLVLVATGMGVAGLVLATTWYAAASEAPGRWAGRWPGLHALVLGKWRIDEAYDVLFVRPFQRLSSWSGTFDRGTVDERLVVLPGQVAAAAGEVFRSLSSGRVRTYALAVLAGAVVLLSWLVMN